MVTPEEVEIRQGGPRTQCKSDKFLASPKEALKLRAPVKEYHVCLKYMSLIVCPIRLETSWEECGLTHFVVPEH
jgi:hypothetical protein